MKTSEEIKKGMECCRPVWAGDRWKACDAECPYRIEKLFCKNALNKDMRDYIQQLEADNAQLNRCIENLTDKLNATNDALPRWIPVEERLPGIGEVLISHCGYVCIAWHHGNGTFETGSRMMLVVGKHDITHWMPLPEPPQEV